MKVSDFIKVSCFCNVKLSYKRTDYDYEEYYLEICGDLNKLVYNKFKNHTIKEIYPTDDGNVALTVALPQ